MLAKILTVALVLVFTRSAADTVWNGYTASWDRDPTKHFYTLPSTKKEAVSQGWTKISGVHPPRGIRALCLNHDPTLVMLFKRGKVVGFQIAFLVSDLKNSTQPLRWDKSPPIIKKTLNGVLYYTATVYKCYNRRTGVRRIWIQEKDRYLEIPTNASLVPSKTSYLLKRCIPTMGTHYYTWHSHSDCAYLYPFALLEHEGWIKGFVFQGFKLPTQLGSRTWWETLPQTGLTVTIPDLPTCAINAAKTYDIMSIHIWFMKKPQSITCNN